MWYKFGLHTTKQAWESPVKGNNVSTRTKQTIPEKIERTQTILSIEAKASWWQYRPRRQL